MAETEAHGLALRRAALLSQARGRVLELGAGTGANLAHYPPGLEGLVLAEPEPPMARRLRSRVVEGAPAPARVLQTAAESLPLADASVDTVVATLVLCTVRDPARVLDEVHRVLAPGGRLLFLEHVRAEDPGAARRQDRVDPVWRRVGHGCRCNRDTAAALLASPLELERLESFRLRKAPKWVRPAIQGVAVRPELALAA